MSNKKIMDKLNEIESILKENHKTVMNFDDVVEYTGLAKSYLYKLTSQSQIPHYKPNGKMIYFNRDEVEQWMLNNKIQSIQELNAIAREL